MTPMEVAKTAYAAFNAGDIETILPLLNPTIEWTEPAGLQVRRGASTVRRRSCGASSRRCRIDFSLVGALFGISGACHLPSVLVTAVIALVALAHPA